MNVNLPGASRCAWGKSTSLWAALLVAAASPAEALEELPAITVTANTLSQSAESVPAAMSVFDGQTLEREHVQDLPALLRRVPASASSPSASRRSSRRWCAVSVPTLPLIPPRH